MTVEKGFDITPAGDRGVLKRLLKDGIGTETPSSGCQVTVHYTGFLLCGTKFDSSRDRNEPFEFTLGEGSVIKAWEIGVATMKKGELCALTCAPEYAYGATGNLPKIPPSATLKFEIEMISWRDQDLSPNKNGGILRHKLVNGKPNETESPNEGATVTVELEGSLPDGTIFDSRTVTFPLSEGNTINVCDGIERALEKFVRGEKSRLIIQPKYAFKSAGEPELGVPPNTVVTYNVTLLDFEKARDEWTMEPLEKLELSKTVKESGTKFFREGNYQVAIKKYKKVIYLLKEITQPILTTRTVNEDKQIEARDLTISSHLNLALVYLKVKPPHYYEAKDHATRALHLEPKNVKALFRRGLALAAINDSELAAKDFQKVLEFEPQNKAASAHLAACRVAQRKHAQREKVMYANMFDKFAKADAQAEKLKAKQLFDIIGEKVGEWGKGEGEWTDEQRDRKPTEFEKENPNILLLDKDGQFENM